PRRTRICPPSRRTRPRRWARPRRRLRHHPRNHIERRPFMIRTISRGYRFMATAVTAVAISLMLAPAAHASGSSMPWEAPLQSILQSIEGPVAKIIAVIVIISTGLALAFGDTGGGFRKLIQIVFGLSIAFAASSFFLSFFSFGGGALV